MNIVKACGVFNWQLVHRHSHLWRLLVLTLIVLAFLPTMPRQALAQGLQPPTIIKYFDNITAPAVDTIRAGQTAIFRIRIDNPNPGAALTNVNVTDGFPPTVVFLTPITVTGDCNGGTVSATNLAGPPPRGLFSLVDGTIPGGGFCEISVPMTSNTPGTYNNRTGAVNAGNALPSTNTGNAILTVLPQLTAPTITKNFNPAVVQPGGQSTLTINIPNPNSGVLTDLTNVNFTDTLPAGLTIIDPPAATTNGNCIGLGTFSAPNGGSAITLTNGRIPSGLTCTITVRVVASLAVGTRANTINPGDLTFNGGQNTAPATANLIVENPLTITKAFGGSFPAGGSTTLLLTITNPAGNPSAQTNVTLTDNLPAPMVIDNPTGRIIGPGCTVGNPSQISTAPGSGTISIAAAANLSIASGASCTIQVNVTSYQNSTGQPGGVFTNSINPGNLAGTVSGVVIPGGTTSATVAVTGPDIQPAVIGKAFGAASINNGDNTTLTFTITNPNAGTPLRGVNFTDTLPTGLIVTNPNGLVGPTGCGTGTVTATASTGTISLANAVVTNGTSCTFRVNVTGITIGGPYTNQTSPVRASNAPDGNQATATLTVSNGGVGSSPLTLAKSFAPNPVTAGGVSTITFTITNPNSFAQFGATFTDDLSQPAPPGNPVYVAATPNRRVPAGNPAGCPPATNLTATALSQTISLTASTIPANTTCLIQVDVMSPTAGTYTNTTGQISSTNVGTNAGPTGRGQANLTVNGPSILPPTISKAFGVTNLALNGTTTLTFTITNPNSVNLTNYTFTDGFPSGIRVAAPPAVGGTCPGAFNPVLTGGEGSITWRTPSLPPGACTVIVNVRGATAGSQTNQVNATRSDNSGPGPGTGPVTVNVFGPPTIVKDFLTNPITAGTTTTLRIRITNPNTNPGTITGVAVDDNLPVGPQQMTAVVGSEAMTASCNVNGGASIAVINGGTTVRFTGGSIARNTTCTLTVTVLAPAVGAYDNQTTPVSSTESGPGAASGVVRLRTDAALASLTIQKSFNPPTQLINLVSRMTIRIDNPANATQTNVSFNDPLPAGLIFSTPPNPAGNCNGGTLTADTATNTFSLTGGQIASLGFCEVSVDVTSPSPNTYTNSTAASSTLGGTGGTASATVTFIGPPNVTKSFSPNPIQVGQNSTITLQFANPNQITTLTGITVTDNLPVGMTVVNPANATIGANCGTAAFSPALATGATVIHVINGAIPGTRTCTITVEVTAGAGAYTNVINPGDVQSSAGPNTLRITSTLNVQNYSLGNRVWIDTNGNGQIDGAEVGVGNVTVQLLDNANTVVGTIQTDASGYYRFDNLSAGAYTVQIPAINFQPGRPLSGYLSSTGNTAGTDSRDNGIDNATPAASGIRSGSVTLGPGLQPAGEGDLTAGLGAHGPNGDAADNLTVDFGFVPPALSSIGNRVWTDTNGNGQLDGGEVGVGNVTVELLNSTNAVIQTIQTDASGYYRFDNVAAGTYTVRVAATNFQPGGPLNGSVSSTGNTAGTDSRDNGIDNATPAASGIVSGTITVGSGAEPLGEGDIAAGLGAHGPNGDASDNLTVDFGFTAPSVSTFSLGNRVWTDTNGNGILDGGEVGVGNVTVQLLDSTNAVVGTMQTDASGYYRFDNVAAGTYTVRVAATNFQAGGPLNGTVSSTGNTAGTDSRDNGIDNITPATNGIVSGPVTLGAGLQPAGEGDIAAGLGAHGPNGDASDNLTLDFGFTTPSASTFSLGNRVWTDTNGNGILDGAEVGVANVTVQLLDGANNVIGTLQTDASGYYRFDNIPAGTYTVRVAASNFQPGGPLNGTVSSTGNTAGTDSRDNGVDNATPSTNGIVSGPVTLGAGLQPAGEGDIAAGLGAHGPNGDANDNLTVDFGFVVPPSSSIGNRVWTDTNGNGLLDGAEVGVGNVIVQLLDSANTVIQTIQTDASGYYRFDNVAAGTYSVRVAASNFQPGGPLNGTVSSAGSAAGTDSRDNGIDNVTPATSGITSGPVTIGPGLLPVGEGDIAAGLGAHGPNGDAADNLTVDFGFTAPSATTFSLGNRVWTDTNGNGILDGAEVGVGNVTVQLLDSANNVIGTMQTDASGYYRFDNIPAGTYSARVAASNFQPGGPLNGTVSSTGNTAGTDSRDNGIDNVTPATSGIVSSPITLGPGFQPAGEGDIAAGLGAHGPNGDANDNLTADFGFTAPSATTFSLGNRVWWDTNSNGTLDAGEPSIPGVTMELLDSANAVIGTMQTDGSGYYRFDNVPAGTYSVRVAASNFQPGGLLFNSLSSAGATAGTDSRDNGIDNATPVANGIASGPITLGAGLQPAGEGDIAAGLGAHGPNGDANDNLTVDFGFGLPASTYSIGNRVWIDTNGNGLLDGGESGIGSITVELLDSANAVIRSIQTDAGGYYRFDNVPAGRYTVRIPASNFQPGAPLEGSLSSTGNTVGTDSRDNGIDNATPAINGIVSSPITVGAGLQPLGEADLAAGLGAHGPSGDPSDTLIIDFGFTTPRPGAAAGAGAAGAGAGAGGGGAAPTVQVADPAIVKLVEPTLALPGETVTYTFVVSNTSGVPAIGVVVTDTVPSVLQVISADASQGTHGISGNTVTFQLGTINPGQTATMHIRARVRPDVVPPVDVTNNAQMGNKKASALLRITRGMLPATGEHPDESAPTSLPAGVFTAIIGIALILLTLRVVRHKRR